MEIRVRLVYEAILNINSYVDDIYVSVGARHSYDRATLTEQYAQYSDNFILNTGRPIDVLDIYVVRRRGRLAPRQPLSVCALLPT